MEAAAGTALINLGAGARQHTYTADARRPGNREGERRMATQSDTISMTGIPAARDIPTVHALFRGLPWIALIVVLAFASWAFWEPFCGLFMDAPSAQYASIGVSTMGAYVVCILAMAGNWPFAWVRNPWLRGIAMIALAKGAAALFWIVLVRGFRLDMGAWSFPIIGDAWLILAATSFVGGDAHLAHIPPVRRMFLNLIIAVGGTILLLRTIVAFPTYWFPFLQATIVTGGLGYLFRRVRQPTFSALVWPLLIALMWAGLVFASWVGHFQMESAPPPYWVWNLGTGSGEFGLYLALACGLNFSVFSCTQSWPFCRIRQPWGTIAALSSMLVWCFILTLLLIPLFRALVVDGDALWQAQIMGWHTVFWGFAWVYCFGIGQKPFLWAGQKTPGVWDDVD